MTASTVVVAVDVGKSEFAFSVTDALRVLLSKPQTGCLMTGPSLRQVTTESGYVLPVPARVEVGIEAAGHYHRPLLAAGSWPAGWELPELNLAHFTGQRRVLGKRTIKLTSSICGPSRSWCWPVMVFRFVTGRWCSVS